PAATSALDRLPHQQADVLALTRPDEAVLELGETIGPGLVALHLRRCTVREAVAEHGAVQVILRAEVVVEHPLVDARTRSDRVDARTVEALCREFVEGGVEDPPLRTLGVARHA